MFFLAQDKASDAALAPYKKIDSLEAKSSARFIALKGLAPCDPDEKHWVSASARKLVLSGQPSPQALVLVAPTFSDIRILALNSNSLSRYRLVGQTAFGPEFLEDDTTKTTLLPSLDLARSDIERINAAISRNTRNAMSARDSGGKDGVMYYFSFGQAYCASTWSPEPETLAGQLTSLVDELLADQPSPTNISHAINSLEKFESAL